MFITTYTNLNEQQSERAGWLVGNSTFARQRLKDFEFPSAAVNLTMRPGLMGLIGY